MALSIDVNVSLPPPASTPAVPPEKPDAAAPARPPIAARPGPPQRVATAAAPLAVKDELVAKGRPGQAPAAPAPLALAPTAQPPQRTDAPTGAATEAAATFMALRDALDRPNGLAACDAFAHPALTAVTARPLAALPQIASFLAVLADNATQLDALAVKRNLVEPQAGLGDKLSTLAARGWTGLVTSAPPNTPAAIARVLEQNFPQIAAAVRQALKSGPLTQRQHEVEVPSPELVAVEAALAPVVSEATRLRQALLEHGKDPAQWKRLLLAAAARSQDAQRLDRIAAALSVL
jgi:hypothetical protein